MDKYKIILFLCNWGPHAAFQALQDKRDEIPSEIHMVRIPCTGRISKSLLLKAFEKGADGVILMGCRHGACHYGTGTETAEKNTEDTRKIIETLGIGKERLKFVTFHPDESDLLLEFLDSFTKEIASYGHTQVTRSPDSEPWVEKSIKQIVSKHDVFACQDCGKCTSACPLALTGKPFSPRAVAAAVISGEVNDESVKSDIWSCLTCGICYDRCPSAVNFPEFIRDVRCYYKNMEITGNETHGGFFQSLMRTMTSPDLKPTPWSWLPEEINTDSNSKVLFFGGCAPYFDIFFREFLGVKTCNILADSLRLLNFFDIQPAILEEERCCGHDLLWSGDRENFTRLAKINSDRIHQMGIEEVITSCPECYRTLAYDYPEHGIELNFKVTHLYELLENEINKGAVQFKKINKKLTFQDSCRLNRFENLYDQSRKLINRINPESYTEMQNNGKTSICCGNSAWIGCDSFSKALQVKRLNQAHDTGSDVLVTSCPKCQIHLKCAMEDPFRENELKIETMDLTSIIAKTLRWE